MKTKNTARDRQWEEFQSNEMKSPKRACYGRTNNRPWDRADVGSNPSFSTYLTSNGYLATQSPHPLACKMRVPPPHASRKLSALSLAHGQPPFPSALPQVLVGDKVNKQIRSWVPKGKEEMNSGIEQRGQGVHPKTPELLNFT